MRPLTGNTELQTEFSRMCHAQTSQQNTWLSQGFTVMCKLTNTQINVINKCESREAGLAGPLKIFIKSGRPKTVNATNWVRST